MIQDIDATTQAFGQYLIDVGKKITQILIVFEHKIYMTKILIVVELISLETLITRKSKINRG